jgi:hypothetical protein
MSDREIEVNATKCRKVLPQLFLVKSFNVKLIRLRPFMVIRKGHPQGGFASTQLVSYHFTHSSLNNFYEVICGSEVFQAQTT